jgi:hypothetical protein
MKNVKIESRTRLVCHFEGKLLLDSELETNKENK